MQAVGTVVAIYSTASVAIFVQWMANRATLLRAAEAREQARMDAVETLFLTLINARTMLEQCLEGTAADKWDRESIHSASLNFEGLLHVFRGIEVSALPNRRTRVALFVAIQHCLGSIAELRGIEEKGVDLVLNTPFRQQFASISAQVEIVGRYAKKS